MSQQSTHTEHALNDDLSAFSRDLLFATARLGGLPGAGRVDAPIAASIRRTAEDAYGEPVSPQRTYPVLGQLEASGLLETGPVNGKSNYYCLTDAGLATVERQVAFERESLNDDGSALTTFERVERYLIGVADDETKSTVSRSEIADRLGVSTNSLRKPVDRILNGRSATVRLVDTGFGETSSRRWEVERR